MWLMNIFIGYSLGIRSTSTTTTTATATTTTTNDVPCPNACHNKRARVCFTIDELPLQAIIIHVVRSGKRAYHDVCVCARAYVCVIK